MGRTLTKLAIAAGAALLIGLPMAAQAAVTYVFVADSSYTPFDDGGATFTGSFTLTVDAPVTTPAIFQTSDLTSCSVTASDGTAATCIEQRLNPNTYGYDYVAFGLFDAETAVGTPYTGETHLNYYFDLGAFSANGVYESVLFGSDQHATLTVSGIGDTGGGGSGPGVPEPATWALMIAGFGLAGTAMRRRRAAAALA